MALFKLLTADDCKYYPKSHFTKWRTYYYAAIIFFFIKPFMKLRYPYKVVGRENIPKIRPFLIASHHVSLLDPPLVTCATNLPVAYMAKKELFKTPLTCWFFKSVACFAVDRDATDVATIKTALAVLSSKEGWCLGLFPQGTRSQLGEFLPLKKGGINLAKKAKVPILPVGIYINPETHERIVRIGELLPTENKDADELLETLSAIIHKLSQPNV